MVTLEGEMATLDALLLERFTVTPPAGAGDGKATGKAVDCPRPTVTFEGSEIAPEPCTVTLAVALETFGAVAAAAVTVVVPAPAGVMDTVVVVAFFAIVTDAG